MMRQLAGVIVKDLPRYLRVLSRRGAGAYLDLCNRGEQLERAPHGEGVRCLWRWTSDLHAPKHLPMLGEWLMRRALAEHPVRSAPAPHRTEQPGVTFIVGHRGEDRVPHLLATLGSIAAQQGVPVECIVVQEEASCSLAGRLPHWVELVHAPPEDPARPFCRSRAFNAGARHAASHVLVLHDNDLLVPVDYAASIVARVAQGWEVVNAKRFIFYLDQERTRRAMAGDSPLRACAPEAVMQNAQGGGSIAITREAFEAIGGMDESFVGWGGEDNEFWERASTRRVWHWGHLPLVHLWHPPQAAKQARANPTLALYEELSAISPTRRIERLHARMRERAGGGAG